MARKWSVEKIARVEAQAERLGELQKFIVASPLFPLALVLAFVAVAGLLIGALEHTF